MTPNLQSISLLRFRFSCNTNFNITISLSGIVINYSHTLLIWVAVERLGITCNGVNFSLIRLINGSHHSAKLLLQHSYLFHNLPVSCSCMTTSKMLVGIGYARETIVPL